MVKKAWQKLKLRTELCAVIVCDLDKNININDVFRDPNFTLIAPVTVNSNYCIIAS